MKRIRVITVALILAIVISASSAIAVINGKNVKPVETASIANNTTTSVSVEWKKVNGVDGYKVYKFDDSKNEFELVEKLLGDDNQTYEFSELSPGTVEQIKVSAFKNFNNQEYEGDASDIITIYSLPDKTELKAYSNEEGTLTLSWDTNDNYSGYEIEYSKDKEFKDAQTKNIDDGSKKIDVKDLTPKDVYYSKIRSYINVDKKDIYSEWSDTQTTEIKEKVVMSSDIDPNKPIVALSFDDGPGFADDSGVNSTSVILDVLEEYGARATFFMVGSRIVSSNKACLEREISLGCELGSHTFDHKDYGKNVTVSDITKNTSAIKKACGQAPTIFRCPGGMITKAIQDECEQEGMPIAYWSVDTEDWKSKDPDAIYNKVMDNVYDGSIILMHDIYSTTAEAVKRVVPDLIAQGYQIVTVSEMLTIKNGGESPKAGQQYIDYKTINNNT